MADHTDIALCWMVEKAKAAGLKIDDNLFKGRLKERKPDGKIHESYDGFWRFRRSKRRVIPENAHIHQSVIDRMNVVSDYKPKLPSKYKLV